MSSTPETATKHDLELLQPTEVLREHVLAALVLVSHSQRLQLGQGCCQLLQVLLVLCVQGAHYLMRPAVLPRQRCCQVLQLSRQLFVPEGAADSDR